MFTRRTSPVDDLQTALAGSRTRSRGHLSWAGAIDGWGGMPGARGSGRAGGLVDVSAFFGSRCQRVQIDQVVESLLGLRPPLPTGLDRSFDCVSSRSPQPPEKLGSRGPEFFRRRERGSLGLGFRLGAGRDPAGRSLPAGTGRQHGPLRSEMATTVARSRAESVSFTWEVVAAAVVTVSRLLGSKGQFGSPWSVSTPKAPRIE